MSEIVILTPDCPECGNPPNIDFVVPFFCFEESCLVISWDPTKTLAEIRAAEPALFDLKDLLDNPFGTDTPTA